MSNKWQQRSRKIILETRPAAECIALYRQYLPNKMIPAFMETHPEIAPIVNTFETIFPIT